MGKTTLLKLILGELEADSGRIKIGTNLQIAYFDQMRSQLDMEATLADTISPGSEWVEINGSRKHIMGYLTDFFVLARTCAFTCEIIVRGERNRLLLARFLPNPRMYWCLMNRPMIWISRLWSCWRLLQDYTGTVFLVSHDRAFLDNVVTDVIAAEPVAGQWREYVGGFYDWQRQSGLSVPVGAESLNLNAPKPVADVNKTTEQPPKIEPTLDVAALPVASKKVKLSYKEQRELDGLPALMERLESEQKTIEAQLADGAIFTHQPDLGVQLTTRLGQIEDGWQHWLDGKNWMDD